MVSYLVFFSCLKSGLLTVLHLVFGRSFIVMYILGHTIVYKWQNVHMYGENIRNMQKRFIVISILLYSSVEIMLANLYF